LEVYETAVTTGNGCLYVFCATPVISYKLPSIDSPLRNRNKYGTTQSVHTNTHMHPPPTPWIKFSFRSDLQGGHFDLSGREFETRCQRKWERSRSRGSLFAQAAAAEGVMGVFLYLESFKWETLALFNRLSTTGPR